MENYSLKDQQKLLSFVEGDMLCNSKAKIVNDCIVVITKSTGEVIKFLQKHSLCIQAQKELIKRGEVELLEAFAKSHNYFCDEVAELLCEFGSDELILAYIRLKHPMLPKKAQEHLANRGNHEIIMAYKAFSSEFAQEKILDRGNEDEIRAMVSVVTLERRLQGKFLAKASTDLVLFYIRQPNHYFYDITHLFKRNVKEEILAYITHGRYDLAFSKQDVLLFQRGREDEIRAYLLSKHLCNYLTKDGQKELIKRGRNNEIICYIEKHQLYEDNQILLIKRGNREEIATYYKYHYFEGEAMVAFLQYATTDVVVDYFKTVNFGDGLPYNAQKVLLERGNEDEIMAYLKAKVLKSYNNNKGFNDLLVFDFIKYRSKNELFFYIHNFEISDAEEEALFARNITEVLVEYIKHKVVHLPQMIINRGVKAEIDALFATQGIDVKLLLDDDKVNAVEKYTIPSH